MTLIEAIQAGKKFGRLKTYRTARGFEKLIKWEDPNQMQFTLMAEDVLADDWQIDEEEVLITKSSLAKAWDNYRVIHRHDTDPGRVPFALFCKELGFK